MKVIKPGNLHASWSHEATCDFCGCQMEVSVSDCHWHYEHTDGKSHPMFDTTVSEVRCKCPTCGKTVKVCAFDGLPRPVQERLRDQKSSR